MLVLLLWHRGCLSDITGALFCCPGTLSGWFPVKSFAFVCCFKRPFCMFLSLNDILQPGASDHSVLYATAQLTEGRSARDQPKQPPAKKKRKETGNLILYWIPLQLTRLCWTNRSFRPLGMQHFYDSFARTSQICVRRDALTLFGLKEDELSPAHYQSRSAAHRAWRSSRTSGQP